MYVHQMRIKEMTSILFIWVLSAGQMQLAASETFYSMGGGERASQRHAPRRTRTSCFRVTSPTIQRYALSAHLRDLVNRRSDYGTGI